MLSKSIAILLALSLCTPSYAAQNYIEMDDLNHTHAAHLRIEEDMLALPIEDMERDQVSRIMLPAFCCAAVFFVALNWLNYIVPSVLDKPDLS